MALSHYFTLIVKLNLNELITSYIQNTHASNLHNIFSMWLCVWIETKTYTFSN